jgi:hypothetical protein
LRSPQARNAGRRASPARIAFMYAICVACLALGLGVAVSAMRVSGADDATARAFRADPSCGADLAAARAAAAGACRVEDAVIESATEFRLGSVRHPHADDVVAVRIGAVHRRVHLAASNGGTFVHAVAADAPARVQLYGTTIVRIEANGVTAQTLSSPDVAASANAQMPWVGAGIAGIGVVFGIAATALRRGNAARSG